MPRVSQFGQHRTSTKAPPDFHQDIFRWELKEDLAALSSAEAYYRDFDEISKVYERTEYCETIYESQNKSYSAGDFVWTVLMPDSQRHEVIGGDSTSSEDLYLCNFTLLSTLALGGTATANVEDCSNGVAAVFGATITVEDKVGKFKGYPGYKGIAFKYASDTECNWTIVELEEQAEMAKFRLVGNWTGTGAGATIFGTTQDDWQGESPAGTQILVDRCGHHQPRLNASDCVIASYDEKDDVYVIIDSAQCIDASADCYPTVGYEAVSATSGDSWVLSQSIDCVDDLRVNEDTWLRLFTRTENGKKVGLLSLTPPCAYDEYDIGCKGEAGDRVFWSDGSSIRWQGALKLAKTIETGTHLCGTPDADGPGWWKQNGSPVPPGPAVFWLGQGGDLDQKWLVPQDEAGIGVGSVLHWKSTSTETDDVDDYDGCMQLAWTRQGVGDENDSCEIELQDSSGEPIIFTIHAGVIVKIINGPTHSTDPGATVCSPPSDPKTAECPDTEDLLCEPCD